MPERIETAEIDAIDTERIEINDTYPGTYGFFIRLDRDPGVEWAAEFDAVYNAAAYPGKPPVVFEGDRICVYYLPRYARDLPKYLRFFQGTIAETNEAVRRRNSVLPNEDAQKEAFREALRQISRKYP